MYFGGARLVDEPTEFDKIAASDFGRCGEAATVRSEAEDERRPPRAISPPPPKYEKACPQAFLYFGGARLVDEPTEFDKIAASDFGRCGEAATVRSEAEDERRPPRAISPPPPKYEKACPRAFLYFGGARLKAASRLAQQKKPKACSGHEQTVRRYSQQHALEVELLRDAAQEI